MAIAIYKCLRAKLVLSQAVFLFSALSTIVIIFINMQKMKELAYKRQLNENLTVSFRKNLLVSPSSPQNVTSNTKSSESLGNAAVKTTKKKPRNSEAKNVIPNHRTLVIILSNQRSGSSFLGDIFNKDPSAYYQFEPLLPYTIHCDKLEQERIQLLGRLLECDFSTMRASYSKAFHVTNYSDAALCSRNNMCFCDRNTGVMQRYAEECNQYLLPPEVLKLLGLKKPSLKLSPPLQMCGPPFRLPLLTQICNNAKVVAYKILRVCSLDSMDSLISNLTGKGYKLRILHLVRDPRGIIASRVALNLDNIYRPVNNIEIETERLCTRFRTNLMYDEKMKSDKSGRYAFWHKQYLRIRYEDLAVNLSQTINKIYRFLGKKVPEGVKRWVRESQPNSEDITEEYKRKLELGKSGMNDRTRVNKLELILKELKNPFSVKHDPQKSLNKWRSTFSPANVFMVQKKCQDVMEKLGYNIFTTHNEIKNHTIPSYSKLRPEEPV